MLSGGRIVQHGGDQETVTAMDRIAQEPGKAVRLGLRSRCTDAKSDLAEQLPLLRRNQIEMVQRSGDLLASVVHHVERDASEPAFHRQCEREWPRLLDLIVAGRRWQVERPQLDGVFL